MSRALVAVLLLVASNSPAETIRVAVARGSALELAGEWLQARLGPLDEWRDLGAAARLESVGPFVSNGDLLAPRLELGVKSGALSIGRIPLLGLAHVVATDEQLVAVDEVDLEDYVASVVGGEMPASWPKAALEAQAIAARTYVLKRKLALPKDAAFHVESTVAHQVYKGRASIDARTRAAAEATRGKVLMHRGALAEAFFFATCRGKTEYAKNAFGKGAPYLVPVSCDGGDASPLARWTKRMPLASVSKRLSDAGAIGDELRDIDVVRRSETGRVTSARLSTKRGGRNISGNELRRLIGYDALPSLDVAIEKVGRDLVFRGEGSGHAVGLCQWCARGRAARGESASRILAHFYPGTAIETAY